MFALLPVLGGFLAGRLAPRRTASTLQLVFYAVALTVLTVTAPDHGGGYGDVGWIAPALAAVSAATLLVGLRLGHRSAGRAST